MEIISVISYYSQPSITRVVRTLHVSHQPVVVTKPVIFSTVSLGTKKAEIVVKPSQPELIVGSTVTASANFLGSEKGFVFVQLGSATLQCEIITWTASSVTFKTPNLGLRDACESHIGIGPTRRPCRPRFQSCTSSQGQTWYNTPRLILLPSQPKMAPQCHELRMPLACISKPRRLSVSEASIVIAQ